MALSYKLKWNNGLELSYHRIVSLNMVTNVENSINLLAYISKEDREREIDYMQHPEKYDDFGCYQEFYCVNVPYDPTMTIESAYDYLKTLPKFENATDI